MLWLIFIWIILVAIFALFWSRYVRKYNKPDALIGIYVWFVIISNVIAYKIAEFDFWVIKIFAPAATLIFAITFLLTDIVNEKFWRKETQNMILIAFIVQVAITLFIWLSIKISPAPFRTDQESFMRIIGSTPRLILASWIAFIVSENLDAYIFSWMKILTKGEYLWMRNIFSSIPSMALDSFIFITIAFYGNQPLLPLIIWAVIIKWIVGVIDIPFMYLSRYIMIKKK